MKWGVYAALALRWERLGDRRWDRRHNVLTSPITPVADLAVVGNNAEHGVEHEPSPVSQVKRLLSALPVPASDTFIDFGSGLGRVVLLAAERYEAVIGVEFARNLVAACGDNVRSYRGELKCEPEIHLQDAISFEVPDDRNLLVWFYAPFRPPIMQPVLEKLTQSYRRDPRRISVMYRNPFHRDLFDALEGLSERPLEPRRGLFRDRVPYVFYVANGH